MVLVPGLLAMPLAWTFTFYPFPRLNPAPYPYVTVSYVSGMTTDPMKPDK